MNGASQVIDILRADPFRWRLLGAVRALNLPDGWVGAGFVRNAVWDHLHGRSPSAPRGDVDVIWHDPLCINEAEDRKHEAWLRAVEPGIAWSVKNQARMHARNGDEAYPSATEAMRYWPETATAVAVRRTDSDGCEVAAPWGLGDLLRLILRPTQRFAAEKRHIFDERAQSKEWAKTWPLLREEAV